MDNQLAIINKIRDLISKDQLEKVFQLLLNLLNDSPYLNELIQQVGRHNSLKKQIRLGILDMETANVSKNQIRYSLLEFIKEIELLAKDTRVTEEINAFENQHPNLIQINDSGASTVYGNVNISGKIAAGRDIVINNNKKDKRKPFWKFW